MTTRSQGATQAGPPQYNLRSHYSDYDAKIKRLEGLQTFSSAERADISKIARWLKSDPTLLREIQAQKTVKLDWNALSTRIKAVKDRALPPDQPFNRSFGGPATHAQALAKRKTEVKDPEKKPEEDDFEHINAPPSPITSPSLSPPLLVEPSSSPSTVTQSSATTSSSPPPEAPSLDPNLAQPVEQRKFVAPRKQQGWGDYLSGFFYRA